jgi:hypothetical protein
MCLSLAKVIRINTPGNRMVRWLEGKIGGQAGGEIRTAQRQYGLESSMELTFVTTGTTLFYQSSK